MQDYKDRNSYNNSLNLRGTEVGERIQLERRLNPKRRRMYDREKNLHMKNQITIVGGGTGDGFVSEYDRTVDDAAKKMASGEAQRLNNETRAAGVV